MSGYIKLDETGKVVATLVTKGSLQETDRRIKVDDPVAYIGKRRDAKGFFGPITEQKSVPVDLTALSADEKWKMLFDHVGIPCK